MDKDKDWFPLFSMVFWCFTKMVGLIALLFGLYGLVWVFMGGSWFNQLLFAVGVPVVIGAFLLLTDTVHELATAAMRSKAKSDG